MKPNAPDFSCKDKDGCGWVQWPPKTKASPGGTSAPIAPPSAPQAQPGPSSHDEETVGRFWDSVDNVLEGLSRRKLTEMFKGEDIVKLIATQFIGRKG